MAALLHTPELFGLVESGVYRCSAIIDPIHIPFLKTLGLKSVLVLSQEPPSRPLLLHAEEANIKLNHIGNKAQQQLSINKSALATQPSSWRPLSDEIVKEGIEFVLNIQNHPVLLMCTSGIHETGTFVGCFRKLIGWNFNSIVVEYRCFAGSKSRYLIQQFIELFDTDLINVPRNSSLLPFWFMQYQRVVGEEEEGKHVE
ncbi:protein-tyrosine phosphatase [Obelidium mucronatum]|nr:protein-tyrosine phosphatase [Obelidium mucronatum]